MSMNINKLARCFLMLAALLATPVQAALEIRITQGAEGAMPVAVVPFGWQATGAPAPVDVAAVVSADLHRSGYFSPLAVGDMPQRPIDSGALRFSDWRAKGIEHVVIGRIVPQGADRYAVQFHLFDSVRGTQVAGYVIPAKRDELRKAAHKIADLVYEKITGRRGAFSTRVAYISVERLADGKSRRFQLQVADSDGYNPRVILRTQTPVMSPVWSPDGTRLAYVSFENRRSEIYVHQLDSGKRTKVASFPGINGAPAWSPDGRSLALTLSKGGYPDIYVLDVATGSLRQLTRSLSIDTEPAWMPDGRSVVFTSDRAGNPQIYQVSVNGGKARRLSFDGRYNARAVVAADGRKLAMVNGDDGRFRIAVLDLVTRTYRILTTGRLDESPSFAPNGSMIIYATVERGRGVLAAVSEDGRVKQSLVLTEGEVREPAWSPFID